MKKRGAAKNYCSCPFESITAHLHLNQPEACRTFFPSKHWKSQMVCDHTRGNTPLICETCREEGFTARDSTAIKCSMCEKERVSSKFEQMPKDDQKGHGEGISCICIDCKTKRRCGDCRAIIEKASLSKSELKYKKDHNDSFLLCVNCRRR